MRRSRDRFKSGTDTEKAEAVATLGYVLRTLSLLMAPFTPFLADALYDAVGGDKESVHVESWPADVTLLHSVEIEKKMRWVQEVSSLGLERRAAAGIPIRQVLASATVSAPEKCVEWMTKIVKEELNVEEVKTEISEKMEVVLDTVLTPELKQKGAVRELVRNINDLRKTAGLTIKDRVVVRYQTESAFWQSVFAQYSDILKEGVLASSVESGAIFDGREVVVDGEEAVVEIK